MWIIEFLENENISKLRNSLDSFNISYLLVESKKGEYFILDNELLIPTNDVLNESFLQAQESVFLYGSKYFIKRFKDYSFDSDSDFLNYENYFNLLKEDMLNDDILIGALKNLEPVQDEFFIRPMKNNKIINGQVMTKESFSNLKERFYLTEPHLYDNELFLISSLKEIKEEYRFFILNKKIVGVSSYKPNRDLLIPNNIVRYVEQKINKIPINTYVIDIAVEENNDLKIIEFNNFNASGIYNIDLDIFVKELEDYLKN